MSSIVAFGGFSYFSGVTIFNVFLYELFNVIYSSWPIILWAVFDEEHTFKESKEFPSLYSPGISNAHFNQSRFLRSVGSAILYGVVSLLVIINIMETEVLDSTGTIGGIKLSGSILFAAIIIIVNLKILVMTTGVKPLLLIMTLLSIAIYWPSEAIYAQLMDKTEFEFVSAQWKYPSAIFCTLLLIFFMALIELGYRKWH